MKTVQAIVTILVILAFFWGGQKSSVKNTKENLITLTSSIEKYHMTMSSQPGLPLEAMCTTSLGKEDYYLLLEISEGQLLNWYDDGKIEVLSTPYRIVNLEKPLYWSPLQDSKLPLKGTAIKVSLTMISYDDGIVLVTKDYLITEQDGGYYQLMESAS